jgi:hypothetical protein
VAELERWGDEIAASDVVDPILFNFRPNKWVHVDAEHRADFERFFQENVGFHPSAAVKGAQAVRWPTEGISGSNEGWDD